MTIDVKAADVPSYASPESVERFIGSLQRLKIEPRTRNYLQHVRITLYGMAEIYDRLRALLAEVNRLKDEYGELDAMFNDEKQWRTNAETENADLRRQITELQKIVQYCSEEHDAGRHDGLPEPCPAHDAIAMWLKAREYLNTQEPQS